MIFDLSKIAPGTSKKKLADLSVYINKHAPDFALTTEKRLAAFIAQTAHESDHFNTFREYASGEAYEGRKNLGNTQKGDGVKFRGRGLIQITGRTNYGTISQNIFGDNRLLSKPELLETPENAVLSAMFYWRNNKLNELADKNDFASITRVINGGTNGAAQRTKFYNAALAMFKNIAPATGGSLVVLAVAAGVFFF